MQAHIQVGRGAGVSEATWASERSWEGGRAHVEQVTAEETGVRRKECRKRSQVMNYLDAGGERKACWLAAGERVSLKIAQ